MIKKVSREEKKVEEEKGKWRRKGRKRKRSVKKGVTKDESRQISTYFSQLTRRQRTDEGKKGR